jgi:hypothetical protein
MREKEFKHDKRAAEPGLLKKASSEANYVNKGTVQRPSTGICRRTEPAAKPSDQRPASQKLSPYPEFETSHKPELILITVHAAPASSQRLRFNKT